ncbi:hypothetical protein [Flavobacterium sp.]|nr:hypothetical protein [Flavobacterium sp.]HLP63841.1 hypothetical protein [Flavobacterium sp.]
MESNEIYQEKSPSRTIAVLKKIGLLILIALVIGYIYISIHFILS